MTLFVPISIAKAVSETRRLKRLLEEKDVEVQAAVLREAAANKRVAEEVEKWKEAQLKAGRGGGQAQGSGSAPEDPGEADGRRNAHAV